jgi:glycosyltransferase involved in cell wall biosynthesis
VQVVDDGSTDGTAEVARQHDVALIQHKKNRGLGHAFKTATEAALARGCDIFVNTDGDNQYPAAYIPDLIQPILDGQADIVIGNRRPWQIKHFSRVKRFFHRLGGFLVNRLIDAPVPDVVSGFRAYSAKTLINLNPVVNFSYVLDTLIQADSKGLQITSIPITINLPTRPSRLYNNLIQYIYRSSRNILWAYIVYDPFRTFLMASLAFLAPAGYLLIRFLNFYFHGQGEGHIQSLIISAIGFSLAGILFSLGVIAKLINYNHISVEKSLNLEKKRVWEAARGETSPNNPPANKFKHGPR